MATFTIPIVCANTTGSTNFRVRYRLAGDPAWTSFLIPASNDTSAVVSQVLDNRLYEFQVQNINNADNPISLTLQSIGITDVDITISPTATTVGYSFPNLSQDITTYTVSIAEADTPGTLIDTHILPAGVYPNTVSDTFTGLATSTRYILIILIASGENTATYNHYFTTDDTSGCGAPTNVTATLNP
jgi:hypothetical protein